VAGERGGDTRAGAPAERVDRVSGQATPEQQGADEASAASTVGPTERGTAPRSGAPADELLCTICGLTACWQKTR
jgi:hypothetical protein